MSDNKNDEAKIQDGKTSKEVSTCQPGVTQKVTEDGWGGPTTHTVNGTGHTIRSESGDKTNTPTNR